MSAIRAQPRSAEAPKGAAPKGDLGALEAEAIGLFIQLGYILNQPRSCSEVYGLLFISTRPLTLDELAGRLKSRRATVNRALQFLRTAGALRIVYIPGDRRMYFEAVAELRHIVIGFVRSQILPQFSNTENYMDRLVKVVDQLPGERRPKLSARVDMLQGWSKKSRELAPIIVKMLES